MQLQFTGSPAIFSRTSQPLSTWSTISSPSSARRCRAELQRAERALIARERLVDTSTLARRKHSAGPYSLDALC